MATLAFNAAARQQDKFSTNSKIRVKNVDGVLFVRPTARKSKVNLPKIEHLIDVSATGKADVESMELAAGTYGLRADKYGWFGLVPGHQGRGPSVKVS